MRDSGRPGAIAITPATARPGQTLALTFPEENSRGLQFKLTLEAEPARVLYCLGSDRIGKSSWSAAGGTAVCGGPDVGISGPGPDHVVVPDTAEDGTYLLCAANVVGQVCGLVTVRG